MHEEIVKIVKIVWYDDAAKTIEDRGLSSSNVSLMLAYSHKILV